MISIKKDNNKYLITFIGHRRDFNEFISNIVKIEDIKFDIQNKSWYVYEKDIDKVRDIFDNYEEEAQDKAEQLTIIDYEDYGTGLKLEPYNYQKEAIKFSIDQKNAILKYPCGSGKTCILIGIFYELKKRNLIDKNSKALIVVKSTLKVQWKKEIEKFSDFRVRIINSKKDEFKSEYSKIKNRESKLRIAENEKTKKELEKEIEELQQTIEDKFEKQFYDTDIYLLNYETLRNDDIVEGLQKHDIQLLGADEFHYVKTHDSQRSKALQKFDYVKYKIGATATPILKNPEDLFGLFKVINPELFGKFSNFGKNFIKYGYYRKPVGFKNMRMLKDMITPYVIQKSEEEIADQLPSLIVLERECELSPKQIDMHKTLMEEIEELKREENMERSKIKDPELAKYSPKLAEIEANIMARQSFAQQLANTEELLRQSESEMSKNYITGSASNKLEVALDLIEEIIESGEKVAIFSKFERMQGILTDAINKKFKNIKIAYVNGSMSTEERYKEVYDKFRDNDKYKVLLLTNAGAEGLNLSNTKYLIEYDLADSYGIQTQRHGRIKRADSIHKTGYVYQLVCKNSWDEIQKRIVEKKEAYDNELLG